MRIKQSGRIPDLPNWNDQHLGTIMSEEQSGERKEFVFFWLGKLRWKVVVRKTHLERKMGTFLYIPSWRCPWRGCVSNLKHRSMFNGDNFVRTEEWDAERSCTLKPSGQL